MNGISIALMSIMLKLLPYVSQHLNNNGKPDMYFFFTVLDVFLLLSYVFVFFYFSGCAVRPGSGVLLSKKLRLLICLTRVIILKRADSFNKTFLQGKKEPYFTGSGGKAGISIARHILPATA